MYFAQCHHLFHSFLLFTHTMRSICTSWENPITSDNITKSSAFICVKLASSIFQPLVTSRCPEMSVQCPPPPPPRGPKFSQFHAVFAKFGKIICWRPLLREILDPPLVCPLNSEVSKLKVGEGTANPDPNLKSIKRQHVIGFHFKRPTPLHELKSRSCVLHIVIVTHTIFITSNGCSSVCKCQCVSVSVLS